MKEKELDYIGAAQQQKKNFQFLQEIKWEIFCLI